MSLLFSLFFLTFFHEASPKISGSEGWFPGADGFAYEIDEEKGEIIFRLDDLVDMPYYLGVGWNNNTHDDSTHTKTMINSELLIWDGGSIHKDENYKGAIWPYFGGHFAGGAEWSEQAMTYWKRTPGSAHPDGKPRWSRTLKRPEGCSKCIEIEKNKEYWVMSARGSTFDGEGNWKRQKEDPKYAAWSDWPGPRAGYHYAKTQREKIIIWKEHEFDNLYHMTNHHEDAWNKRVDSIGQKNLTKVPQNSAQILCLFSSLLVFLGINLV
ncbi:Oidioi.mRNA.OKI2018_I69.XSR.g16757.t1.cds [Oikopleura dioica]|uniref:Oidioi.mRNA.OKI2018_I69.XSR.g16757.t1.cds n=1 Tax=Oikopleura dioica TaxID=34765 RepID=A0ABN7SRI2_OIKDI|nr:Oidioi.mRNA.OKI2018_I69.XSR.g16757.t1.cds [Oikopleura dioica]